MNLEKIYNVFVGQVVCAGKTIIFFQRKLKDDQE